MTHMELDVIDHLASLLPFSPVWLIRDRKPVTRQQAQASYYALFEPVDAADMTVVERFAVATFVSGLHAQDIFTGFYLSSLAEFRPPMDLLTTIIDEWKRGRAVGPFGAFPAGPLSVEDMAGPVHQVAEDNRATLGPRLTAAFAHVHMLVFHPRDAKAEALQALLDAGWSNSGIVTLSQLVAFLAFQIRAAAGLRTLAATPD